jgi:V/A-type H+/Na+-transporting ATPase subunit D
MAILPVNPTRMELTRLKKRLVTARRGHKLLKDKRDELMRQFLETVRETKKLRRSVEARIVEANNHMSVARSLMQNEVLAVAMMHHKQELKLSISERNVMGVRVPVFEKETRTDDDSDIFSYGFAFTSSDLDEAILALSGILPDMLRLAELEKACQLMSSEIEKTRRRVNALEHFLIPGYEETIRYITMKLSENERGAVTRLMKVKDMIVAKAIEERRSADG